MLARSCCCTLSSSSMAFAATVLSSSRVPYPFRDAVSRLFSGPVSGGSRLLCFARPAPVPDRGGCTFAGSTSAWVGCQSGPVRFQLAEHFNCGFLVASQLDIGCLGGYGCLLVVGALARLRAICIVGPGRAIFVEPFALYWKLLEVGTLVDFFVGNA